MRLLDHHEAPTWRRDDSPAGTWKGDAGPSLPRREDAARHLRCRCDRRWSRRLTRHRWQWRPPDRDGPSKLPRRSRAGFYPRDAGQHDDAGAPRICPPRTRWSWRRTTRLVATRVGTPRQRCANSPTLGGRSSGRYPQAQRRSQSPATPLGDTPGLERDTGGVECANGERVNALFGRLSNEIACLKGRSPTPPPKRSSSSSCEPSACGGCRRAPRQSGTRVSTGPVPDSSERHCQRRRRRRRSSAGALVE